MTGWCRRCSRLMAGTRLNPRCVVCGLKLTPEAQVDIDAPLSGPGPLRVMTACYALYSSSEPTKIHLCHAKDGEQCARGDDAATCPYAIWLELDCSGLEADCEGQLVEPLPEDAGTELEGIAELLSDVWSFVDGDGDGDAYSWPVITLGRSAHERGHVNWCRDAAARFMARARISTGDCEGPSCAC